MCCRPPAWDGHRYRPRYHHRRGAAAGRREGHGAGSRGRPLLGVPQSMLDAHGAVYAGVAAAMANGVRQRLGATFGVATTGVAGPDPADGQPVGNGHIAVSAEDDTVVPPLALY